MKLLFLKPGHLFDGEGRLEKKSPYPMVAKDNPSLPAIGNAFHQKLHNIGYQTAACQRQAASLLSTNRNPFDFSYMNRPEMRIRKMCLMPMGLMHRDGAHSSKAYLAIFLYLHRAPSISN